MRASAIAVVALILAPAAWAGTIVTPTTTLTQQTSNNTSAANTFTSQSNGNLGATNISKVNVRSMIYAGSSTPIYAHLMAWFGQSNHMNVGYASDDPTQVHNQVSDAISRGISGFILDWYGPNNLMPNQTAFVLKSEAESRAGAFTFSVMYDGGALNTCYHTSGCDLTQQAIKDLTYAYNNFEGSTAYMKVSGRPVVTFFDPDRYGTLNWPLIASSVPGNPLFIFRNAGGFTHSETSGSFSWITIDKSNANDWGQAYLDNFYSTAVGYSTEQPYGSGWKGFNDTLAAWTANRIMNQNCGQTWLVSLAEMGKYYSSAKQLQYIQLVTWNDYEEGTELESGIENCVTINAAISSSVVNWSITGSESTVDHYTVYISTDGENLMPLPNVPAGTHSLDLSTFGFAAGTYKVYVQAVGKPMMRNEMSGALTFTAGGVTVSSPGNGSSVTSPVHFVASATSPNPITTMRIYVDSVSAYTVSAGSLDTYLAMAAGPHFVVVQAWDSTGAVFKTPMNISVASASTTTSLSSSANPSYVKQAVTFTATVHSAAGTPTGAVTFQQGTTTLATVALSGGSATLTKTFTSAGTYPIVAVYSGGGGYPGSTSATLSQTVTRRSTKTAVTTSLNPSNVGQPVQMAATVTSAYGTPPDGGTVTFFNGSTVLGSASLTSGAALLTTSSLPAGADTLKAVYAGSSTYSSSTGKFGQTVNGKATSTAIVSSLNSSIYGQSVTFKATVSSSYPGTPGGTITFFSGTTMLARVTMSSGAASLTISSLPAGTKSITALYSGDASFAQSTSPVLSQVVDRAPTTTATVSSPNDSLAGQSVTFTATVKASTGAVPTGTMTFTLGSTTLGRVTVGGSSASLSISALPGGSSTVKATFTGSNFQGSSGSVTQVVK